jgi:hypothetical protein
MERKERNIDHAHAILPASNTHTEKENYPSIQKTHICQPNASKVDIKNQNAAL